MKHIFCDNCKIYFRAVSLILILVLVLSGCGAPKSNVEPEIANTIKTNIADSPPDFDFIHEAFEAFPAENNSEIINEAKSDYARALNLIKRIDSGEKPSNLTNLHSDLETLAQKMKDAAAKNDWIKTWQYAREILVEGYSILPFSLPDSKSADLYAEALNNYNTCKSELEELEQKTLDYENNNEIDFESWLNLSYVENGIEEIKGNLFKQVEEGLSYYRGLTGGKFRENDTKLQIARSLSEALSDTQMAKNSIDYREMIVSSVKKGRYSLKDKRAILDSFRERAEKERQAVSSRIKSKTWGKEIYKYSTGNYEDAKKLENDNFYSLALLKYQMSYIFAALSKDWMEYPDIINYPDIKAHDVSAEEIISSWNDSVKELNKIDRQLTQYKKDGKIFLNIRLAADIFYSSWFMVGDSLVRRFVEEQRNFEELGNMAYMNIGPVPAALKIIEEDLKNLATK
jgi:hypothetical protein